MCVCVCVCVWVCVCWIMLLCTRFSVCIRNSYDLPFLGHSFTHSEMIFQAVLIMQLELFFFFLREIVWWKNKEITGSALLVVNASRLRYTAHKKKKCKKKIAEYAGKYADSDTLPFIWWSEAASHFKYSSQSLFPVHSVTIWVVVLCWKRNNNMYNALSLSRFCLPLPPSIPSLSGNGGWNGVGEEVGGGGGGGG